MSNISQSATQKSIIQVREFDRQELAPQGTTKKEEIISDASIAFENLNENSSMLKRSGGNSLVFSMNFEQSREILSGGVSKCHSKRQSTQEELEQQLINRAAGGSRPSNISSQSGKFLQRAKQLQHQTVILDAIQYKDQMTKETSRKQSNVTQQVFNDNNSVVTQHSNLHGQPQHQKQSQLNLNSARSQTLNKQQLQMMQPMTKQTKMRNQKLKQQNSGNSNSNNICKMISNSSKALIKLKSTGSKTAAKFDTSSRNSNATSSYKNTVNSTVVASAYQAPSYGLNVSSQNASFLNSEGNYLISNRAKKAYKNVQTGSKNRGEVDVRGFSKQHPQNLATLHKQSVKTPKHSAIKISEAIKQTTAANTQQSITPKQLMNSMQKRNSTNKQTSTFGFGQKIVSKNKATGDFDDNENLSNRRKGLGDFVGRKGLKKTQSKQPQSVENFPQFQYASVVTRTVQDGLNDDGEEYKDGDKSDEMEFENALKGGETDDVNSETYFPNDNNDKQLNRLSQQHRLSKQRLSQQSQESGKPFFVEKKNNLNFLRLDSLLPPQPDTSRTFAKENYSLNGNDKQQQSSSQSARHAYFNNNEGKQNFDEQSLDNNTSTTNQNQNDEQNLNLVPYNLTNGSNITGDDNRQQFNLLINGIPQTSEPTQMSLDDGDDTLPQQYEDEEQCSRGQLIFVNDIHKAGQQSKRKDSAIKALHNKNGYSEDFGDCDFSQIDELQPDEIKQEIIQQEIGPNNKIQGFLSPRPNLKFSILNGQQESFSNNQEEYNSGKNSKNKKNRRRHQRKASQGKITYNQQNHQDIIIGSSSKKQESRYLLNQNSSKRIITNKQENNEVPMRNYIKQTKILNSSSRDVLNNNFIKESPTPCDGVTNISRRNSGQGGPNSNNNLTIINKDGCKDADQYQLTFMKRTESDLINEFSNPPNILDSIQMNISLSGDKTSRGRLSSKRLKKEQSMPLTSLQRLQVQMIPLVAGNHEMTASSLNEKIGNTGDNLQQQQVTQQASVALATTLSLAPMTSQYSLEKIQEMPSNRQGGDTELTPIQANGPNDQGEDVGDEGEPAILLTHKTITIETDGEKEEFLGITRTSAASMRDSLDPFGEETKALYTTDVVASTLQKQDYTSRKEVEQIKQEHLIQTLQSLQYVKTAERPPKAQIILKSFNMPNKDKNAQKEASSAINHQTLISPKSVTSKSTTTYHFTKNQRLLNSNYGQSPITKQFQSKQQSQQKVQRTLLFDLDETLIHCVDDCSNPSLYQHLIEIKIQKKNKHITHHSSNSSAGRISTSHGKTKNIRQIITKNSIPAQSSTMTVQNLQESSVVKAGINVRPYALECLQECEKMGFEIAIFTASHQSYADAVLDQLIDPQRRYPRLYRQHCIRTNEGIYIKDLRVIRNRLLKDIILVDNAVYSFGFQLTNGIPILPFYKDEQDRELIQLVAYLKNHIVKAKSIQQANAAQFKLASLAKQDLKQLIAHAEAM